MKRLTIFLLLALPVVMQAQDYTCTTNNGSLIIMGYHGHGGAVIIPSTINGLPVTEIGDKVFSNYGYSQMPGSPRPITSVKISKGITCIGNWAFNECVDLTNVMIPNSVTSIGNYAFEKCGSLAGLKIPNSVTNIGQQAFDNCHSLTSIKIPDGVFKIGNRAFFACFSVTNIAIPDSVTSIEGGSFGYATRLTNITIPASVTNIDNAAFADCTDLKSVYFRGNAPIAGWDLFSYGDATVYYLPGTTGWGATFGGRPTALWKQ